MKNLLLILALLVVGCASSEESIQKMRDYENSIYEQYEAAPGYKSLVRSTYITGARKYLQFSSGHSSQFNANKAAIEKGLEAMKGFPFLVIKEGNKNVERDSFNNFHRAQFFNVDEKQVSFVEKLLKFGTVLKCNTL